MFSLIDVGERSGSGLCDLYNTWKEFGYKTPALLETVDPDRITLTLQVELDSNHERNDSNLTKNKEYITRENQTRGKWIVLRKR